ncbi:MAG TPA: glycosyltransferase family 4 protein [Polyangiales bacterium]|nr:glycosyltransferase family 4 protein [Polyangiales bacterium]
MKLLALSNCPLLAHQGSGYITLGYVEGLRSRGWHVDAFGPEHFEPLQRLGKAKSWRITFGMLFHVLRCLMREHYDIVELYGGEAWLAIAVLSRWPGRQFLLVSHSNGLEPHVGQELRKHLGADTHDGQSRRWYQIGTGELMASGFRRVDALVMVSDIELRYARDRGYQPDSKLLAIDNPLPDGFRGLPLQLGRPPLIVYCGSWITRKGTAAITADMPRILREFPEAKLRLIGVGEAFRAEDHFPADVLGQIEVLPFVSNKEQLRAAYAECAISIAPSAFESFGLTIAEAMACGCAVVASRTGFAASLRDGVEACLLAAPSAPHVYTQVKRLLEDPQLRDAIAAAGHARAQRLKWPSAIERLSGAYEMWLAELRGNAKPVAR